MTDAPHNPFEDLMKMGQDWAQAMGSGVEAFTPAGIEKMWPTMPAEVMEAFMGKTLNPEGLDAKTRLLLTLQGLTILGAQAEAQIRLTVRHAREAGASAQEITETIALAGLFGGVPAMSRTIAASGPPSPRPNTSCHRSRTPPVNQTRGERGARPRRGQRQGNSGPRPIVRLRHGLRADWLRQDT